MGKGGSQTVQMIAKPLLSAGEIIRIPFGEYIVIKSGGCPPMMTKLPYYTDYLPKIKDYKVTRRNEVTPIKRMSTEDIKSMVLTVFRIAHRKTVRIFIFSCKY